MNKTSFAKGINAEDLRIFLTFWQALWPQFVAEGEDARKILIEDQEILFNENTEDIGWCKLYELPFKQHTTIVITWIAQCYAKFLPPEQILSWFKEFSSTPSQIGALPELLTRIGQYFTEIEDPSKDVTEAIRPHLAGILGANLSMFYSIRCVLYHGCFMNELIERVRAGDDKALFDAIRIDSTVIGCYPAIERISKAALLQDNSFFAKLKTAINGKMAKREQANFQKMRLVFEVLHEAGATRLSDAQLHEIFVEELKLYSGNAKGGGNAKALRKFADTYMKKNTTT